MDALRDAPGPITTDDIAAAQVIVAEGFETVDVTLRAAIRYQLSHRAARGEETRHGRTGRAWARRSMEVLDGNGPFFALLGHQFAPSLGGDFRITPSIEGATRGCTKALIRSLFFGDAEQQETGL